MTTIGYATLEIIPSLRGVSDAIDKGTRGIVITPKVDMSGARSAGQQAGADINTGIASANVGNGVQSSLSSNLLSGAEGVGQRLGGLISSGLKTAAVAGGTLAAGGLAAALHAGFSRLTAIDDAKFKLQGLGNSTQQVQSIMDNALAAVKGTAFGLDEAATTAAAAVAAGIQPGQQLTGYLKETADTAAIAGTSLADMGSIFNQVQTSGKAFTGDLNQLADRGIPVFTWLQQATGKTGEEFDKLVQQGGISAQMFQDVIAKNIGGAAQTMGGSVRGSLDNLKASFSRFGAELSGPIFAGLQPLSIGLTGVFDSVTTAIKPIMASLTATIGPWATDLANRMKAWADNGGMDKIVGWFDRLRGTLSGLLSGGGAGAVSQISDSMKQMGPALQSAGPALAGVGDSMKAFGQAILAVGPDTLSSIITPALRVLAGSLKFVADNASWAVPLIGGVVAALAGFRVVERTLGPIFSVLNGAFRIINAPLMLAQTAAIRAQAAAMTQLTAALGANTVAAEVNAGATNVGAAATIRGRIAAVGSAIAQKAVAVATGVWTGAQWLLNAALDANPIGLIVLALAGLTAGIIYAYNHSETFRKIVQGAWNGIKTAAEAVVHWFTDTAWPFLKKVWEGVSAGWNGLVATAEAVWTGVKERFTAMVDFFRGLPGAIANAASNMWEGLKSGLVEVLRWIADKWNKLTDTLSFDIPDWVPVVGGKQWHLPKIPAFGVGGYTGNMAASQVAGVVHGDEHVIKAPSRVKIENAYPGLLDFMNQNGRLPLPGYADGGRVTAADLHQFASGVEGKPYKWGGTNWGDCSGAVSALANYATGRPPFGSRFATATEGSELAARGFKSGLGPAGSLNIGWFNGGPYGGHTAATLPDGTNFEMGGRRGNGQLGGGAAGANNSEFTNHAFLPPEFFTAVGKVTQSGQLDAGAPTTGSAADGGGAAATAPSSGGSSGAGIPTSFSDAAKMGFDGLGAGVGATKSGSDLSLFGKAAGSAVSGQVSSARGVLGVGDSPGWLQAASKLIGGVKVSGGDGSTVFDGSNPFGGFGQGSGASAAPLSATPSMMGTPPPDGAHAGTGQPPGPAMVTNWTINARDTEDAFIKAQRLQDQKTATKVSRF